MVKVFKTTVENEKESIKIINELKALFPHSKITIDLEDYDHILRIEKGIVSIEQVAPIIEKYGHEINFLED